METKLLRTFNKIEFCINQKWRLVNPNYIFLMKTNIYHKIKEIKWKKKIDLLIMSHLLRLLLK